MARYVRETDDSAFLIDPDTPRCAMAPVIMSNDFVFALLLSGSDRSGIYCHLALRIVAFGYNQSHMLDGTNTAALVLAQAAASFSRSELRWEFANTAAAVVLLPFALAAMVLFGFRRATRDPTLIYFALFCLLSVLSRSPSLS